MEKLRILILLSLILVVIPLVSYIDFLEAETFYNKVDKEGSSPDNKDNENTDHDTYNAKLPKIFFENSKYDFGKIIKGQQVEYIFKFENQGNADLKIKKVKTSCGCTAAILTNEIIPPSETGEIKATFRSGSFKGKVMKSITVNSNDPDNSSYKLTLSGEIIELISTRPGNINFGSAYAGGEISKSVTITSDSNFKIKKIIPSKPFVRASAVEENEKRYTINVVLRDNHEIGRFNGDIYLETDNPKQQKIKIPFFGEIIGDITTYPKKIYYSNTTKGKEIVQKVFVRVNKENIKILDINVSPEYISARIIEDNNKNNSQFLIEVKLHKGAIDGKLNGLLEINTNSEMQPSIRVPIIWLTGDGKG